MSEIARAIARASPARTRSASEDGAVTSGGQQLPRNHEALHLARDLKDTVGESDALSNLGIIYQSLSKKSEALTAHQQARRLVPDNHRHGG